MKKILFPLILIIALFSASCKKKVDREIIDSAGMWAGTYSGLHDSGTWSVEISTEGIVTGNANSTVFPVTLDLTGSITPYGDFTATAGTAENGTVFTGQFTETEASGRWENTGLEYTGSWTGTKQGSPLR